MEEETEEENGEFAFQTVGEQLKAERERREWTLEEVAKRTRIPIRHLESIETSNFSKMPGSTYTLGFTRSYARVMEMDEAALGSRLRDELAASGHGNYQAPSQEYEPTDPSRVPSKMLAWTAAIVGVLIVAGYFIWRSSILDGNAPAEEPAAEQVVNTPADSSAVAETPSPATDPDGQVVLTATNTVWLKIYDADNNRLFEDVMDAGDSFSVPQDANKPMILTGRPDMLTITIGGTEIAPLGDGSKTVANVEISAAALSQRSVADTTQSAQ